MNRKPTKRVGLGPAYIRLKRSVKSRFAWTPRRRPTTEQERIVNLRGIRSAGLLFMAPTYVFVATLAVVIAYGVFKTIAAAGSPEPAAAPAVLSPDDV